MPDVFTDMLLDEAIARQVRAYLVDTPKQAQVDGRTTTRLLAGDAARRLVLDVPRDADGKVFVPVGTVLGLAFSLGRAFVQGLTTVRDHCQFPLVAGRRMDTIIVDRPEQMMFGGYREHVRSRVSASRCIPVSLWRVDSSATAEAVRDARLLDQSPGGMGVRVANRLTWPAGSSVLIRVEDPDADEHRFHRARLVHCSRDAEELWVAGFDNVAELGPGHTPALARLTGAGSKAGG